MQAMHSGSGKTAFVRGWSNFFQNYPPQSPFRDRAGVTSLPAEATRALVHWEAWDWAYPDSRFTGPRRSS